jgi:hypothetical protein
MKITLFFLCCFSTAAFAAGTDIYLFSIGDDFSFVKNISQRDGYDNQPSFTSDSESVLFTSDRDNAQMDIFRYELLTGNTVNLTNTRQQNEFSARPVSDAEFSYILQEGVPHMSLWKRSFNDTQSERVLNNYLPAAYYTIGDDGVLFWARYASALYFEPNGVDVGYGAGEQLFVLGNVGTSIHQIPKEHKYSFVHRQTNGLAMIKSYDSSDGAIRPIAIVPKENEEYCWGPNQTIYRIAGKTLMAMSVEKQGEWKEIAVIDAPKFINGGRCAVSPDGKMIAIVNTFTD